jgi:hypothetical protein
MDLWLILMGVRNADAQVLIRGITLGGQGIAVDGVTGRIQLMLAGVTERIPLMLGGATEKIHLILGGVTERIQLMLGGVIEKIQLVLAGVTERIQAMLRGVTGRIQLMSVEQHALCIVLRVMKKITEDAIDVFARAPQQSSQSSYLQAQFIMRQNIHRNYQLKFLPSYPLEFHHGYQPLVRNQRNCQRLL